MELSSPASAAGHHLSFQSWLLFGELCPFECHQHTVCKAVALDHGCARPLIMSVPGIANSSALHSLAVLWCSAFCGYCWLTVVCSHFGVAASAHVVAKATKCHPHIQFWMFMSPSVRRESQWPELCACSSPVAHCSYRWLFG